MAEPGAGVATRLSGIGVGLVATPRFHRSLERFGDRLLERVFTPAEIAYARRKRNGVHNLAARFAVKCAGRQLVARLSGASVPLRDLEVVRRKSGEPSLVVHGRARAALPEARYRILVSITHDADFALATVWLEREAG